MRCHAPSQATRTPLPEAIPASHCRRPPISAILHPVRPSSRDVSPPHACQPPRRRRGEQRAERSGRRAQGRGQRARDPAIPAEALMYCQLVHVAVTVKGPDDDVP